MEEVSTVGIDLAKSVFQVHGADAGGAVVFRKKLRRDQVLAFFSMLPRCVVAMEACASAHHWAREIAAFGHGRHAGSQATHADHRRAREQNGEDRLGADGARRIVQSSGRGGMTAKA